MNHLRIVLHSFVCDAPARAIIKCTKMHSGYSSCEKCDQHGEWAGKVIFSCSAGNLRIDEGFVNRIDDGHHLPDKDSPLDKSLEQHSTVITPTATEFGENSTNSKCIYAINSLLIATCDD